MYVMMMLMVEDIPKLVYYNSNMINTCDVQNEMKRLILYHNHDIEYVFFDDDIPLVNVLSQSFDQVVQNIRSYLSKISYIMDKYRIVLYVDESIPYV